MKNVLKYIISNILRKEWSCFRTSYTRYITS